MSCHLDGRAAAELSGVTKRETADTDTNTIHWLEKKALSPESIETLKNNGLFDKINGKEVQEDLEVERNTRLIDA